VLVVTAEFGGVANFDHVIEIFLYGFQDHRAWSAFQRVLHGYLFGILHLANFFDLRNGVT